MNGSHGWLKSSRGIMCFLLMLSFQLVPQIVLVLLVVILISLLFGVYALNEQLIVQLIPDYAFLYEPTTPSTNY